MEILKKSINYHLIGFIQIRKMEFSTWEIMAEQKDFYLIQMIFGIKMYGTCLQ